MHKLAIGHLQSPIKPSPFSASPKKGRPIAHLGYGFSHSVHFSPYGVRAIFGKWCLTELLKLSANELGVIGVQPHSFQCLEKVRQMSHPDVYLQSHNITYGAA